MADLDGSIQYFRLWRRRQYLTRYEQERRAMAKAEGARRVDVTLDAKALDDYATVLAYLKGMNRLMAGLSRPLPPIRLSATEVIRTALDRQPIRFAMTRMKQPNPAAVDSSTSSRLTA